MNLSTWQKYVIEKKKKDDSADEIDSWDDLIICYDIQVTRIFFYFFIYLFLY